MSIRVFLILLIWPFFTVAADSDGEDPIESEEEEDYIEFSCIQEQSSVFPEEFDELVDSGVEAFKSAKAQLIVQCDGYLSYLQKMFGCGVCQVANAVFNAKAYDHAAKRKKQLNVLLAFLADSSERNLIQYYNYLSTMDFKGKVGLSFKLACTNTLKLHCPNVGSEQQDEESLCIICMENKRNILTLPCAHLIYCQHCAKNCVDKKGKSITNCSKCSASIEEQVVVDKGILSTCIICQKNTPNIATTKCYHTAFCEQCVKPDSEGTCSICFAEKETFKKIFR